eukprot:COSAG01_NODE_3638_length_5840_cov_4.088312_3_plen_161_part_00
MWMVTMRSPRVGHRYRRRLLGRPPFCEPRLTPQLRVRGEIMGSGKYENAGKYQSVLIMNDTIISTHTRSPLLSGRPSTVPACSAAAAVARGRPAFRAVINDAVVLRAGPSLVRKASFASNEVSTPSTSSHTAGGVRLRMWTRLETCHNCRVRTDTAVGSE